MKVMKMSAKTKNTIGLVLLFAFGIVTGMAMMLVMEGALLHRALANPDTPRLVLAHRLDRELGLTGQQREEVDVIIDDTMAGIDDIREQTAPMVQAVLDDMKDRVSEVLTPDQEVKFDSLYEHFTGVWEKYGHMRMRHRYRGGMGSEGIDGQDDEYGQGNGMGGQGMGNHGGAGQDGRGRAGR